MENIGEYHITGGTGTVIKECFKGTVEDLQEFIEDIKSGMCGWVENGQDYSLPWHDGEFCKYYTDAEITKSQFDMSEDEIDEDETVIWFEKNIDEDNEEFYLFGKV